MSLQDAFNETFGPDGYVKMGGNDTTFRSVNDPFTVILHSVRGPHMEIVCKGNISEAEGTAQNFLNGNFPSMTTRFQPHNLRSVEIVWNGHVIQSYVRTLHPAEDY